MSIKANLVLAFKIALIVGIIFLINNPDLLSQMNPSKIHMWRMILTFFVPFCVSLYSSVAVGMKK